VKKSKYSANKQKILPLFAIINSSFSTRELLTLEFRKIKEMKILILKRKFVVSGSSYSLCELEDM